MSIHKTTTKQQKIAIVANSSAYTYRFRLGLIKRLMDQGIEVYVIAPIDQYSTKMIALGIKFLPIDLGDYSTSPFRALKMLRQLRKIYHQHQFDLIIHYTAKPNIFGTIAAALNDIPSIAITTGLGLLRENKLRFTHQMLFLLYRISGKLCQEMWFLNEEDRQLFLSKRIVVANKTKILPSEGVNIRAYQPNDAFNIPYTTNQKTQFLLAGRIVWSKGIKEFIDAAKYFKAKGVNVTFNIIGFIVTEHPDGVSYDLIQQWHQSGIINYLGETDDIRPYIEEADAVVLPSFFGEGVPRILLEAASMAKPIITTDSVGCKEVVIDGHNGFLCKARSTRDLIKKLDLFLSIPPSQHRQMGLAGRKLVLEKFDEEIIIQHYLRMIKHYIPSHQLKKINH